MNPTRPALRYFGGKWRLAPWIISHFPPHVCYVEPFGGAASVLLRKLPSQFDVYNDLSGDLVNFFDQLRDNTEALIRAIRLTPYARAELARASEPANVPLERARRLYVQMWQGWGGKRKRPSWRYQHSNNRGKSVTEDWAATSHLYEIADRLRRVFIECDDAARVIERYDRPHTLYYLDPPYLPSTRSGFDCGYDHELTQAEHEALLQQICDLAGMVIISGYPSDLYESYLRGWKRCETTARTINTSNTKTEVIWLSPAVQAAGLPLFRSGAGNDE